MKVCDWATRDQGFSLFGGQDEEEGLCYMRYLGGWGRECRCGCFGNIGSYRRKEEMEARLTDHERGMGVK